MASVSISVRSPCWMMILSASAFIGDVIRLFICGLVFLHEQLFAAARPRFLFRRFLDAFLFTRRLTRGFLLRVIVNSAPALPSQAGFFHVVAQQFIWPIFFPERAVQLFQN